MRYLADCKCLRNLNLALQNALSFAVSFLAPEVPYHNQENGHNEENSPIHLPAIDAFR
jgi:hypothetical protein